MSGRLFRAELIETDDKGDLQTTKLYGLAGEELTRVHRVTQFGFHSHAPKGSHGMAMQFGGGPDGGRRLHAVLGLEHPQYRPKEREVGSTAIYDQNGSIVSLVEKEIRVVHAKAVHLKAPEIVLEGTIYLGGKDGAKQVHRKGDADSDGDLAVGAATKVYAL